MSISLAQATAKVLHSLNVGTITYVPGFGASQTYQALAALDTRYATISYHEEVAFGITHGASLTGIRSACLLKAHGFAKALNGIMDSLSSGVTAGLVLFVFEDKTGEHSDNIIEIEPVIKGIGLPYTLSSAETLLSDVSNAYNLSEKLALPYAIIIDAEAMNEMVGGLPETEIGSEPRYKRDIIQHLVCPLFASYQKTVLDAKVKGSDWKNIQRPPQPVLPSSLPPDYQKAVTPYLPLFEVFKTLPFDIVTGDAGVSTLSALEPYGIVNFGTYMGGSIPLTTGAYLAGNKKCWAFTGDFSFIAAGHMGLLEAVMRNIPIKVLIYANGRAQTTGGQPVDLTLLEILLKGYEEHVHRIEDPMNRDEVYSTLKAANDSDRLEIIIANYTS